MRPGSAVLDPVTSPDQPGDHVRRHARFGRHDTQLCLAGVERARHVKAVQGGCINRLLEVRQAEVHQVEEELNGPLILLVAARRAEGDALSAR